MQLALIGLPGAGVKTIFSAITGLTESAGTFSGAVGQGRVAVLKVPDHRLDEIAAVYQPKKKTPATVEVAEFPGLLGQKVDNRLLARSRESDALVLVIRAFASLSFPHFEGSVDPLRDLTALNAEMLLSDLAIVETRLERLDSSLKKRKTEPELADQEVLLKCRVQLEGEKPIRDLDLAESEKRSIRGFGFLSAKPVIVLLNIGDNQLGEEEQLLQPLLEGSYEARALCGDIEAELSQMDEQDRATFMQDFGIEELAAPVVLNAAYRRLEVVTFYTYGEDECRAWVIQEGDSAVEAAGKIHSDLAQGFIRAEVVSFEDFSEFKDIKAVKAQGRFRLEGKTYIVQDGDLIIIRHSG